MPPIDRSEPGYDHEVPPHDTGRPDNPPTLRLHAGGQDDLAEDLGSPGGPAYAEKWRGIEGAALDLAKLARQARRTGVVPIDAIVDVLDRFRGITSQGIDPP